jgi:hypothetical protein
MTFKVIKSIAPVIIFIVTGFFIQAQDKPSIIWQNEKAIGLRFNNSISNPIIKVAGRSEIVSGKYQKGKDSIVFYPLWSLSHEVQYEIWQDDGYLYSFHLPIKESVTPPRLNIYPAQKSLPENLLKFYFVFSEPMSVGKVYEDIYLLNDKGEILQDVFLNLSPELWNRDNTILTLWLDPGRIKRDLALNKMKGNPLNKGDNYELIVSENWKTAKGVRIGKKVKKPFYVESSDRVSPNTEDWSVRKPKSQGRGELIIEFEEPLDFVLLEECISILYNKQPVKGKIEVAPNSLSWIFSPIESWNIGVYKIIIETRLEDLVGNNLNRLFDEDLKKRKQPDHIKSETVELLFELD